MLLLLCKTWSIWAKQEKLMCYVPVLKNKSVNFKSQMCSEYFREKILSLSLYEI